jgi:hypothetical protein
MNQLNNEPVDLKPFLKYNNGVVFVFKVLAAPFNCASNQFDKLSVKYTQHLVAKWSK